MMTAPEIGWPARSDTLPEIVPEVSSWAATGAAMRTKPPSRSARVAVRLLVIRSPPTLIPSFPADRAGCLRALSRPGGRSQDHSIDATVVRTGMQYRCVGVDGKARGNIL